MYASIHINSLRRLILVDIAVSWLSSEVEAVIAAMAAGDQDYTLEQVVALLIENVPLL